MSIIKASDVTDGLSKTGTFWAISIRAPTLMKTASTGATMDFRASRASDFDIYRFANDYSNCYGMKPDGTRVACTQWGAPPGVYPDRPGDRHTKSSFRYRPLGGLQHGACDGFFGADGGRLHRPDATTANFPTAATAR